MWRRLLYALSLLLGIAGFATIPFIVGLQDVLRTVGEVGWTCMILFVVNASGTLILPAIGWWLLMRAEGLAVSLSTAVRAALIGFPLDFVVPSAYLGGGTPQNGVCRAGLSDSRTAGPGDHHCG